MDAHQPAGLEEGLPGPVRLHRRADALEPVEQHVPELAHAIGVGRDEPQPGTARERLPQPHARQHPERLRRRGHLPHHLQSPRLGREGHRLSQERPPVAQGGNEREAGEKYANDHGEHMFA